MFALHCPFFNEAGGTKCFVLNFLLQICCFVCIVVLTNRSKKSKLESTLDDVRLQDKHWMNKFLSMKPRPITPVRKAVKVTGEKSLDGSCF